MIILLPTTHISILTATAFLQASCLSHAIPKTYPVSLIQVRECPRFACFSTMRSIGLLVCFTLALAL